MAKNPRRAKRTSNSDDMDLNHTIECLLHLRSVRDQFDDAGLDLSAAGLAKQLDILKDELIDHLVAQRELRDGVGLLTVAVVGDFNSGKSTFINALLGKDLSPVGEEPTTSSVTYFIHGDHEHIEQQSPYGERKPISKSKYRSLVRHNKMGDTEPYIFYISVNAAPLEHIRLVDTPGFNAPPPNTNDTRVTENAIKEADVLFVLMDIRKGNPTKSLLGQLSRLKQNAKDEFCPPMFLLLNKAEALPPSQRTEVKKFCETQYVDQFRDVTLVSALQLNDSDNSGPFDMLQTATQQIRDAIMRRDPFETLISAEVVAEKRPASYRMDINGNIYEIPPLSGSNLASREELYEMVRSVEADRHVLLNMQFQRKTTQLREDWQKTLSNLDYQLKLALGERTGVNGGTDDTESMALEAIDKATRDIIDLVDKVCAEVMEQMVTKTERIEEGFFSNRTFYQIIIDEIEVIRGITTDHAHWGRISSISDNLDSFLDRLPGIAELFENEDGSGEEGVDLGVVLRNGYLEYLDGFQAELRSVFQQDEDWKLYRNENYIFWFIEYPDNHLARDEYYNRLDSICRESGIEYARDVTRNIQAFMDSLKEPIVSNAERIRSRSHGKAEELYRLQQRINELKEYTP